MRGGCTQAGRAQVPGELTEPQKHVREDVVRSVPLPSFPPVSGLVTAVVIVQEERDSSERAALA